MRGGGGRRHPDAFQQRHTRANKPNTWLIIYGRVRALPQLDTYIGQRMNPFFLQFTRDRSALGAQPVWENTLKVRYNTKVKYIRKPWYFGLYLLKP